jgi:hypothetical protein
MGFETRVLNAVAEYLGTDRAAEFYNGTLFVDCTSTEALAIGRELEKIVLGGVRICAQDSKEYSFDFVV